MSRLFKAFGAVMVVYDIRLAVLEHDGVYWVLAGAWLAWALCYPFAATRKEPAP